MGGKDDIEQGEPLMALTEVQCSRCKAVHKKENKEINRATRQGKALFCSRSCAAKTGNAERCATEMRILCPSCGISFLTSTHSRAKKHCSRSCASRASMNESRRDAQRRSGLTTCAKNLISSADMLRRREAWKYEEVKAFLLSQKREFKFEYTVGGGIFDLALTDRKVLVEFDGPYHRDRTQIAKDEIKAAAAQQEGFTVVRRIVSASSVIPASLIYGL